MAIRSDITRDMEWWTGTDHVFEFTIYQADGVTVQPIGGWQFSWFLKRGVQVPDAQAMLALTNVGSPSPAEVVIVDGPNGRVDVIVRAGLSRNLPGGTWYHELKRVDTNEEAIESYGTAVLNRALHRS